MRLLASIAFALASSLPFAAAQTPSLTGVKAPAKPAQPAWVTRSNSFAQPILAIGIKYSPELASSQGIAQYDTEIGKPTLATELASRKEEEEATAKLRDALKTEKDEKVRQDLEIMIAQEELGFRQQDFSTKRRVPFINATGYVYGGLQTLLDDQVPPARREAAVIRLKKYAGQTPGYQPVTDLLIMRLKEQMAKPGVIYPAKSEMETQLARNASIVEGIGALFTKYKLTGWEPGYAALNMQLTDYAASSTFRLRGSRQWRTRPSPIYRRRCSRSPPRLRRSTAGLPVTTATSSANSRSSRSPAKPFCPSMKGGSTT